MKEAFQQQAEIDPNDMMMSPTGRPMMKPEAMQRKIAKDRARAEEVSQLLRSHVVSADGGRKHALERPESTSCPIIYATSCRSLPKLPKVPTTR